MSMSPRSSSPVAWVLGIAALAAVGGGVFLLLRTAPVPPPPPASAPTKPAPARKILKDDAPAGRPTEGGGPVEPRPPASSFVAGLVKDAETKEPVAGARVAVGDAAGAVTGPDGAFRVERVPEGDIVVTASAPGYAAANRHLPPGKAGREGLVLLLAHASSVSGVVLGPDGTPAAGANVTVRVFTEVPMAGTTLTGSLDEETGADGKFRVEGVPLGKSLKVSAWTGDGFAAPVDAGPLEKGKPAEGLVLRLSPAATLVVTVLDEAGKPVEGTTVTAAPTAREEPAAEDPGPAPPVELAQDVREGVSTSTATDDKGVARLQSVSPGRTKVTAHKQDLIDAHETVEAVPAAETALTLRQTPGAAVTGKVVDDLGKPVADATIILMRFQGGDPIHETRKCGVDGTFKVGGLQGAGFRLNAVKHGFVPSGQDGVDPAAGPVTVTLQRGGAVAGVVQDEEGKPVASFRVTALRTDEKSEQDPMDFMGMGDMGGTEFKDEGGRFRVDGLAPGTYTVTAKAPDFAPGRVAEVKVEAGATAEVKVVLPAGLAVHGIVVRRGEETPVAGATVTVVQPGPLGDMDMDFDMGDSSQEGDAEDAAAKAMASAMGRGAGATTGPDGRFVLKGLEAGTVDLKVKSKEFAPATQKGVAVPSESEVRIVLSEGAAIEGTVYDARKAPKAGAMVMLQKLPMTMKMATTDARGRYRIAGLAPGKYLYYVMENPEAMMGGGGGMNLKSETVTLEEGRTLAKDYRMGEGVRVTGKVTRGGKPVGSTMVMLLPGTGRKDLGSAMTGGSGFAMATTKEDGTYEITGLSPGTYTAMVQSGTGGGPAPGDAIEIRAGATEVRRDIVLSMNAVRGLVVDDAGKPVSGAKVSAVVSGKNMTRVADLGEALAAVGGEAMTGADGRFAMEGMNAGSFTMRVSSAGKGAAIAENVVPSEEGTEIRVVLERGVEVTVRVLDAEGKPVPGAGIYLSDPRGMDLSGMEMLTAQRTGADGRVVVSAPPGTVHYEAIVRGHAPGTAVASTDSGTEVVITLPRGASLEVLVTDAGGTPMAEATVRLLDAAGNPYAMRVTMEGMTDLMSAPATGSDGRYSRSDLPAGTYTVRAASGERTADAAVTLVGGEKKAVTVRLP